MAHIEPRQFFGSERGSGGNDVKSQTKRHWSGKSRAFGNCLHLTGLAFNMVERKKLFACRFEYNFSISCRKIKLMIIALMW